MNNTSSSPAALQAEYVGKQLEDVSLPAAVLDRAIVKRNCGQMLKACDALGVMFRPHVKTHKTAELTRLQVGDVSRHVNIIVSTIAEAEYLIDYLRDCTENGRVVNVLYGIPLSPSQARRLGRLGKTLGAGSIGVMVDNVDQLASLQVIRETAGFNPEIFIKVDTGYGRAGLSPASEELRSLVTSVLQITGSGGPGRLCGFYSHSGHSYGVGSKTAAMKHLSDEIDGLLSAVSVATSLSTSHGGLKSGGKYVLSVGATPSATSIQNLYGTTTQSTDFNRESKRLRDSIQRAKEICKLELHAGVYPVLDMQQLATQASPSASSSLSESVTPALSVSDIALTIFTEVASVYTTRTPSEALIAAGSLALGREPCKSYSGWGVVSNWGMPWVTPVGRSGWEVGRVSQEHGILQGAVETAELPNLKVGQKVRIWPNHACVAGASFGFYLIVDSDLPKGRRNEIVDVWTRCRGW